MNNDNLLDDASRLPIARGLRLLYKIPASGEELNAVKLPLTTTIRAIIESCVWGEKRS